MGAKSTKTHFENMYILLDKVCPHLLVQQGKPKVALQCMWINCGMYDRSSFIQEKTNRIAKTNGAP
jgi:hypothetical protein